MHKTFFIQKSYSIWYKGWESYRIDEIGRSRDWGSCDFGITIVFPLGMSSIKRVGI